MDEPGVPTSDPLYPGATVSAFNAHLMLLQVALKHSLTKVALSELLGLLRCLLPSGNHIPTSFYIIKKYFEHHCPSVAKLKSMSYCGRCHYLLVSNESCRNGCAPGDYTDFLYVPLSPQLERMIKGEEFTIRVKLYHSFSR